LSNWHFLGGGVTDDPQVQKILIALRDLTVSGAATKLVDKKAKRKKVSSQHGYDRDGIKNAISYFIERVAEKKS